MTTIAAYSRKGVTYLAADRQSTTGARKEKSTDSKLIRVNPSCALAMTGVTPLRDFLRHEAAPSLANFLRDHPIPTSQSRYSSFVFKTLAPEISRILLAGPKYMDIDECGIMLALPGSTYVFKGEKKEIYHWQGKEFEALGSGMYYALGAMAATEKLLREDNLDDPLMGHLVSKSGVESASKFCNYTGYGVDTLLVLS